MCSGSKTRHGGGRTDTWRVTATRHWAHVTGASGPAESGSERQTCSEKLRGQKKVMALQRNSPWKGSTHGPVMFLVNILPHLFLGNKKKKEKPKKAELSGSGWLCLRLFCGQEWELLSRNQIKMRTCYQGIRGSACFKVSVCCGLGSISINTSREPCGFCDHTFEFQRLKACSGFSQTKSYFVNLKSHKC